MLSIPPLRTNCGVRLGVETCPVGSGGFQGRLRSLELVFFSPHFHHGFDFDLTSIGQWYVGWVLLTRRLLLGLPISYEKLGQHLNQSIEPNFLQIWPIWA